MYHHQLTGTEITQCVNVELSMNTFYMYLYIVNIRTKTALTGMCLGLEEWWLHKGVLNLQNLLSLMCMLKLCLEFLVDIMFCVKWLYIRSKTPNILVLVSEFSGGCFI